jgi:cell division transport system permease protein
VTYEDQEAACARFHDIFQNQPAITDNVDCAEVIPTSLRVKLADPALYEQVKAALGCGEDEEGQVICTAAGVREVADYRDLLDRLVTITNVLSYGVLAIAVIMLGSAIALVANTLRMGMFARRKEIGIMRLVGATNWRIRIPFLIEGLVEALLGAATAIVALFIVKVVAIDRLRGEVPIPLIRNSDVMAIAPWILAAAVVVAVIAGTIGMRRFLDV